MVEETQTDYLYEVNGKLRDLEEKQNLTRDRVLLIGKNLIDSREKTKEEIANLKMDFENLKKDISKLRDILQNSLDELEDTARKGELEAVKKQLDLFSPLEFARIDDVEKMLHKHKSEN